MKKIILMLLVGVFILNSGLIAFANETILYNKDNVKISLLEERENYQKMKVTYDNKTQIMEYYDKQNGDSEIYISSIKSKKDKFDYKIIRENGNVKIFDTEKIIDSFSIENSSIYTNEATEVAKDQGAELQSTVPNSDWKTTHITGYTSRSVALGDLSMIIGVIATIMGLSPGKTVVSTVAMWYFSRNLPDAWYYHEVQARIYDGWAQTRTYWRFYTNSDYNTAVPGGSGYSDITNVKKI